MQYELSYWERTSFIGHADVLVLGSGLVGLSAAIHLKTLRPQQRVVVLERGTLPIGASTRNAGFACFGSMTELLDDMAALPPDEVWDIVERRWKGLLRLRANVGDAAMDYRGLGGYEMFTATDRADFEACCAQMETFNRAAKDITGHEQVYTNADGHLPKFGFAGVEHLILNQAEGQIDTGKMMAALLAKAKEQGVEIWCGLEVAEIHDEGTQVRLRTGYGWSMAAKQLLVCTNGFAARLLPDLPVVPARNQVLITQPVPHLPFEGCFHYDRGYFYFRNIDGRILLGGGRNLDRDMETTDQFGSNEKIRAALLDLLHNVICPSQNLQPEMWWTGILGLGPVKKPIVQRISPTISVAVRMSGMGVAIGSLVGEQGAEIVLGGDMPK
jgi:gamma-glutamylputrescine oxidase